MSTSRDFDKEIAGANSLAPAARTTTANGTGVDLAGYTKAAVLFVVGAITDGTHTFSVEESDDNSTFTTVAAGDLSGTPGAATASTNQEIGYLGTKRYIRAKTTITGSPATGGVYAAVVVRAGARTLPQ